MTRNIRRNTLVLYTVYAESQYGNPKRVNLKSGGGKAATPIGVKGIAGEKGKEDPEEKDEDQDKKDTDKKVQDKKDPEKKDLPKGGKGGKGGKGAGYRFNWSTPMLLLPHDPKTLFYGGNFLFMSTERRDSRKKISPDLTYGGPGGGKQGGGAHSLFTISESPRRKGVIWTGSDDGRIHVTRDAGETWADVSKIPGMPKDSCISRVEASSFDEGTCSVSIARYRNDDRKPYVFKTTDYGKTWTNITGNLPDDGSVHVVIESSKNKNLLFVGTEFGLFVSLAGGNEWHKLKTLPTVAVHDLIIHPRDRDLVIGTHGRGIFVIDDISPLEQLTPEALGKPGHLFEVRSAVAYKVQPSPGATKQFVGQNPPYGAIIRYHLKTAPRQPVTVAILDATGKQVASLKGANKAGLHQVVWDLRGSGAAKGDEPTVRPGDYQVLLDIGGEKQLRKIRVDAE